MFSFATAIPWLYSVQAGQFSAITPLQHFILSSCITHFFPLIPLPPHPTQQLALVLPVTNLLANISRCHCCQPWFTRLLLLGLRSRYRVLRPTVKGWGGKGGGKRDTWKALKEREHLISTQFCEWSKMKTAWAEAYNFLQEKGERLWFRHHPLGPQGTDYTSVSPVFQSENQIFSLLGLFAINKFQN